VTDDDPNEAYEVVPIEPGPQGRVCTENLNSEVVVMESDENGERF
jgi:hypothetical protein